MKHKFRVWDKESQNMYYNYPRLETRRFYMGMDGDVWEFSDLGLGREEPNPLVAMLYTGIHDSEGIAIYEGDIYLIKEGKVNGIYVVTAENMHDFVDLYKRHIGFDSSKNLVVIGNVQKNPDLGLIGFTND